MEELIPKIHHKLQCIEAVILDFIQEQRNQRNDIQRIKERLDAMEINSKQRFEVTNARMNGIAKLIKEKNHD